MDIQQIIDDVDELPHALPCQSEFGPGCSCLRGTVLAALQELLIAERED